LGEKEIFNEINRLLEDEGLDIRISDMDELNDFLEENEMSESEVYEEIRELYDQLVMGSGMW
jgi:hypothetical protein